MCDREWELARLQKTKDIIEAVDDAILALTVGGVLEYTLNTTQSSQRVTRQDVTRLAEMRDRLLATYDTLCARLTNGGAINVVPGALP